ncbi:MAG: M48 family metalloprotease [Rhodothermales bacterium]
MKMLVMKSRVLFAAAMIAIMSSGCVTVEQSLVTGNKRAFGYTWAQEVQIGSESDPQIVAEYGVYDNAQLSSYVEKLGQELLSVSHLRRPDTPAEMKNTPFTFRVLDSPVVNAFALPGGYVYVTRGLLAYLDNEAQLAVVIGHEIGHVVGRHASKRAAQQQFGQLGVLAGAIGAQAVFGGNAAESVLNTVGSAAGLLFLRYGRDDERESDDLGVEYASMLGYQSGEGSRFFRSLTRMQEQSGQSIPSFMSTHPDPGEREATIQRMASEWAQQYEMTKVSRDSYLALTNNMVVGEDPRQGYAENGMFYHPTLRFQFPYPSGYQVINQPTQVVVVEPNQKAIIVFSLAQDVKTARDAGAKFAAQEGITVINQGAANTNGLSSYEIIAKATSQEGAEYQLKQRYVEYGGNVYSFLGYAAAADYDSYANAFNSTFGGFRSLTDQSKINVQPTRIDLITTSRSGPFSSFLPNPMPRGFTEMEVAIMNQVNLDTNIGPGVKLKIPR